MNNVIKKFEMMYKLGVRSFAVFFDDIVGEGKRGDMQALLLNKINDEFVKVKKDVTPLVMCPTAVSYTHLAGQMGVMPKDFILCRMRCCRAICSLCQLAGRGPS